MRNHLFKMTLIAGLMTSVACLADVDMDNCLKDNADKPDLERMAFCNGKTNQAAGEAKRKELQQKYESALAELNKQQPTPAKTQPAPVPSEASINSSSDNTGTSAPANESGTTSEDNTTSSNSTSGNSGAANSPKMTQPVPRDKPKGVQWY